MLFAMISRHAPSQEQIEMAAAQNIEIDYIGDRDAFTVCLDDVQTGPVPYRGVIVVHPAMAMRLASHFMIGVFENANRAPIGEKPDFKPTRLEVYDLTR